MNRLAPSGPAKQVVINDPTQETLPPVQHHVLQVHEEVMVQKSLSLGSLRADDVTNVLLVSAGERGGSNVSRKRQLFPVQHAVFTTSVSNYDVK